MSWLSLSQSQSLSPCPQSLSPCPQSLSSKSASSPSGCRAHRVAAVALALLAAAGLSSPVRAQSLSVERKARPLVPRTLVDFQYLDSQGEYQPPKPPRAIRELDRGRAIRQLYERYRELGEASGYDLALRVDDLVTHYPEDYGSVFWIDQFTLAEGWRVRLAQERRDGGFGQDLVHLDMHWEHQEPQIEARVDQLERRYAGATILQALRELTPYRPGEAFPLAITSYAVEVRFGDRTRRYRAAAFLSLDDDGEVRMTIEDQVCLALEEVQLIADPVVTREELEALETPVSQGLRRQTGAVMTGDCEENSTIEEAGTDGYVSDATGHDTGLHSARVSMYATCNYDTECTVECVGALGLSTACTEAGALSGYVCLYHELTTDSRTGSASAYDGPATCGVAFGCGVKECCIGRCGGSVSFNFGGSAAQPTVGATASGDARVFNLSATNSVTCPPPTHTGGEDEPGDPNECPCSPILVDLDRGGFRLTDNAGGVRFDLDGDGDAGALSWTDAASGDAFLALDRDGNGTIDDGTELFGNFTAQPAGADPNGYRALAVFDAAAAGGDGDGRIGPGDAVFARLELWIDADHDGVSDPGETTGLAAAGVLWLDLDPVVSRRRDRYGNELRYSGRVKTRDGMRQSVDVFLLDGSAATD